MRSAFRHLLIRDAAYDALPKAARADLHERFALWLDERGQDLVERDEIVGYHLEQAIRYRGELGPADDATTQLAAAAAGRLRAAGVRALEREDANAARNLLERAVSLLPPEQADIALEVKLAYALFSAEPQTAGARLPAAADRAEASGDLSGALWARLEHLAILTHVDPEGRTAELESLIEESRPVFEEAGYDVGLAAVWGSVCWIEHNHCRFDAAAAAAERAIEHAKRAGDLSMVRQLAAPLLADTAMGSMPLDDYLAWLDGISAEDPLHISVRYWRAMALTLRGRFDEARALHEEAQADARERGARIIEAIFAQGLWRLEMEAGDIEAAERAARHGCELLQAMGERSWLSTQACHLAESLFWLGRDEDATEWAELGLQLGAGDDVITQVLARQVLAKLAARRGERGRADALMAEAVERAEGIQNPVAQADVRMTLAEVLALTGRSDEAGVEVQRAAAIYVRKGATAPLARARRRLAKLTA